MCCYQGSFSFMIKQFLQNWLLALGMLVVVMTWGYFFPPDGVDIGQVNWTQVVLTVLCSSFSAACLSTYLKR